MRFMKPIAVALLAAASLAADKPDDAQLPLDPVDAPKVREDAAAAAERKAQIAAERGRVTRDVQEQMIRVKLDMDQAHEQMLRAAQLQLKLEKGTYLGVGTGPAEPGLRAQLKLPQGMGLLVVQVEPQSPAEEAGVKVNDVLEKLNDQLLVNAQQLSALVRSFKAGDEVTLTVIRENQRQAIKVKLTEKDVPPLDVFDIAAPMARAGWITKPGADVFIAPPARVRIDGKDGRGGGGRRLVVTRDVENLPGRLDAVTWSDNDMTLVLTVKANAQGRDVHLVAEDADGKVLYDGGVNTDEEREALPDAVKKKLMLPGVGDLMNKVRGN